MKTRTSSQPYIDANVLIDALVDKGEKGKRSRLALRKRGTVSSLTIDEILWGAKKNGYTEFSTLTHELLMHPNLDFIEVRCTTTLRASEFMRKHNLKPRDAMHLAIMEEEGTNTILSYDKDFDRVPSIIRIEP